MFWEYKDVKLHYEIEGSGTPIFLIHGYFVDHHLMYGAFEPVFTQLEQENTTKSYERIYLDVPGMGESTVAPWVKNADDMLEILLHFIEDISQGRKFLISGESYGGYLARAILTKISKQILGAIFICPCIIPDYAKRTLPEFMAQPAIGMSEFEQDEDYKDFVEMTVIQTPYTFARYKKEIMSGIHLANEKFLVEFQKTGYSCSFEVDQIEQPYTFPTLFFTGKQDDAVGYEDAFAILKNYKNASFLLLDQAGHNLQIEQEEIFHFHVKKYFKEL